MWTALQIRPHTLKTTSLVPPCFMPVVRFYLTLSGRSVL